MRTAHLLVVFGSIGAACTTNTDRLSSSRTPMNSDAGVGGSGKGGAPPMGSDFQPLPDEPTVPMVVVDLPPEPDGTPALTVVHGIVDAETVRFCFEQSAWQGKPVPSAGLEPGEAYVFSADQAEAVLTQGARWLVVTGEGSADEGCADLAEDLAGAPTEVPAPVDGGAAEEQDTSLRRAALPAIASDVLDAQRSYALTLVGCMGAAGHTDVEQQGICGAGYSPSAPTVSALLTPLSRVTRFNAFGVQFLNASLGGGPLTARSGPPPDRQGPLITLATDTVAGQINPLAPNLNNARDDFGSPLESMLLRAYLLGAFDPALQETWRKATQRGHVETLEDGNNFTVVLTGPRPNLREESWYNQPAFTVIANDPAAE